jgi:hypothetical protein
MKPVSMLRTGSPAMRQEVERRQPQGLPQPELPPRPHSNIAGGRVTRLEVRHGGTVGSPCPAPGTGGSTWATTDTREQLSAERSSAATSSSRRSKRATSAILCVELADDAEIRLVRSGVDHTCRATSPDVAEHSGAEHHQWPRARTATRRSLQGAGGFSGLWGAQSRSHAASLYSWMSPPSRSRRSTRFVGECMTCSFRAGGSGGFRLSARCGLWLL